MSWASEGLRSGCWVGEGFDGGGSVVSRHSCCASFKFVDGHGERSAEHRRVVCHLVWQVELFTSLYGDGCAEHASCVFQHEVDLLGRYLLCRDDEVTFVFTVFVIDYYHEFAFTEVVESFLDGAYLEFRHIFIYIIRCKCYYSLFFAVISSMRLHISVFAFFITLRSRSRRRRNRHILR